MNTITKVKFVFLFILCVATLSVNAHPGRTDSNGGHYDRSTGEYHYHDGKYAGREQSGSTSKKEEKPFTPPREPEPKTEESKKEKSIGTIEEKPEEKPEEETEEKKKETSSAGFYVIGVLIGVVVLGSLCAYIHDYIQDHTTKIIKKYDESLKRTISHITEGIDLKKKLSKIPTPILPEGVEIGEDGLPKETGAKGWGKSFTGYRTAYGYKIHYKKGCSGSYKKEHLYFYRDSPCLICFKNIPLPDFSWYDSLKKVASIKNEINRNNSYLKSRKETLLEIHTQCNYSKNKLLMSKQQKLTVENLNIQYDLVLELL